MSWILLAALAAASPSVTFSGESCPGVLDVSVTGLTPGGQVAFVTGSGVGSDALPAGVCGGADSGLESPRLAFVATDSDGDGELSFSPTIPEPACGQQLSVIDRESCTISSPVSISPPAEAVWLADTSIKVNVAGIGEFVNQVFHAAVDGYRYTCGDPLDPPTLSHMIYEDDVGVVRSWSTGDPDFDQLATCFTDGEQSSFWIRGQRNYIDDFGVGGGWSQPESWFMHGWWDCDPVLGPICDFAGYEILRIDYEVLPSGPDEEGWRGEAFYSIYGTPL